MSDMPEASVLQSVTEAEVISAVPLTPEQRRTIEIRLIKLFKKPVALTLSVDQSLLGGVRIITNNMVIDDTVKRKLFDMKNSIYKGVFQPE